MRIKNLNIKHCELEKVLFEGTEVIDADKTYEYIIVPENMMPEEAEDVK